jgi:hypothetical protein
VHGRLPCIPVDAEVVRILKCLCLVSLCVCLCCCSKSELLVVLKQPEGFDGPTHISLITDNANHLVLHWGTCKPGGCWGGG